MKNGEQGQSGEEPFRWRGQIGLREESARLVLGMEGWLLARVRWPGRMHRGMKLQETGRTCSTCALDKEFYSEVFLLSSAGVWEWCLGVSECCEIRDTSPDT